MRKDLTITTAIAAALLTGACNRRDAEWTTQQDTAICTDSSGRRIADVNCRRANAAGGHGGGWYYLNRGRNIPPLGERVAGGSYQGRSGGRYVTAPVTTAVTRSVAISRGGFGSSARGFGGFGE
ncbi:hypothetical protein [Sphingomonas sp. Mn802worker]|uniref:hypothetical protein n=1 Tax=Sphingomonas sp. Mn802worker TaxID=629773 RepID=UPI0009FD13F3|nr:hypothetical protein [Sphingomonas sp. Mn802worker]